MTHAQYKIFKYISKHDDTEKVCKKFKTDYLSLQYMLPERSLEFNYDCSKVYLTHRTASDVEARRRDNFSDVIPIIVSIIALLRPEIEFLIKCLFECLRK